MFNRYYEDELNKLKNLAVEFAQSNPALAPMLSGASADPDVERLLEGVAFLTGLTRQKLDAEFPEFVQELANLLFPHYLRPVPGTTLVQFTPKGSVSETVTISEGVELASLPVDGTPCRFRTTQALSIEPLRLQAVSWQRDAGGAASIALEFELTGVTLTQWSADKIRLFLSASYSDAANLFLLLSKYVKSVTVTDDKRSDCTLSPAHIVFPGFEQPLLPYPGHSFTSFRFIQEFFVLPEKFLFVDLLLESALKTLQGSTFRVKIDFDSWPDWGPEVRSDSFQMHVAPAINLFSHPAEPISHEHRLAEYRITPEGRTPEHHQVYAIDSVLGYRQGEASEHRYLPFGLVGAEGRSMAHSYRTIRRPATVGRGSELFLALNNTNAEQIQLETLSIQTTCSNRHLPESLKLGDIRQPTSSSPDRMSFRNIRVVTPSFEPPAGEELLWRMISHLSLNFLSLVDANNLRALLSLYLFSDRQEVSVANRRRIDGISEVKSLRESRLVGRSGMMRGQCIQIYCQSGHFAGMGDLYLFGCILENLIADYTSISTFSRVELIDTLSGAVFRWSSRMGQQRIL